MELPILHGDDTNLDAIVALRVLLLNLCDSGDNKVNQRYIYMMMIKMIVTRCLARASCQECRP